MKSEKPQASCGSRTDVGKVRPHNEDSLVVLAPLYAVADGMGGHEAGEVASEIAIETLVAQAPRTIDAKGLTRAVEAANRAVIRGAQNGVGKPGMGTTLTAAVLDGYRLIIAQVGDSRAYLLHEGILQQITRDHSLMADMIEKGEISEEEAKFHPQRSVITRALGSDPVMQPDIYEMRVTPGDKLLLCSDGLSGMCELDQMQTILMTISDPQDSADELIKAANDNGGHDNVTAIVINVGDGVNQDKVEHKRSRKARFMVIGFLIAVLLVIAAAGYGIYAYAYNSAYLIAEEGNVTIYRGLPGDVLGIKLSWLEEKTDVSISDLPATTAERLSTGIQVASLDEADALVVEYKDDIAASKKKSTTTSVGSTGATATTNTGTGTTTDTGTTSTGTGTTPTGTGTTAATAG